MRETRVVAEKLEPAGAVPVVKAEPEVLRSIDPPDVVARCRLACGRLLGQEEDARVAGDTVGVRRPGLDIDLDVDRDVADDDPGRVAGPDERFGAVRDEAELAVFREVPIAADDRPIRGRPGRAVELVLEGEDRADDADPLVDRVDVAAIVLDLERDDVVVGKLVGMLDDLSLRCGSVAEGPRPPDDLAFARRGAAAVEGDVATLGDDGRRSREARGDFGDFDLEEDVVVRDVLAGAAPSPETEVSASVRRVVVLDDESVVGEYAKKIGRYSIMNSLLTFPFKSHLKCPFKFLFKFRLSFRLSFLQSFL